MSDLESIKATFFEECSELMEQLEGGLLALQADEGDDDTVDSIFRAVHSVKGGAGAFHLSNLVEFAHEYETVLDGLRNGKLSPTRDVVEVLLRACDILGDLVDAARDGSTEKMPIPDDLQELGERISSASPTEPDEDPFGLGFVPVKIDVMAESPSSTDPSDNETDGSTAQTEDTSDFAIFESDESGGNQEAEEEDLIPAWAITFSPHAELLETGNEPLFLFRSLQVLGALEPLLDETKLPSLDMLDVATAHLEWVVLLRPSASDLTETEIESVFEFTDSLCDLKIERRMVPKLIQPLPPAVNSANLAHADADAPRSDLSSVTDAEAQQVPETEFTPSDAAPSVPTSPAPPKADPASKTKDNAQKTTLASSIRVDLDRVDRLVNLVGELVISQSMLAQSILRDGLDSNSRSASGLDDLQQLTRDIQDSVMAIRAQPVKPLFQRMSRIVREAAQMTNKEVVLETDGEATEIDKTVVERLSDPLTHMIRNAIDHGLEAPDERESLGKRRIGKVRLTARQQSDRVVIEVSDDGRGINRNHVLQRAIDRGLVTSDKALEPAEIDRLLFLPGFSTATDVSALSGRGVGMDVVQRAIRDLNGTVSITSQEGKGSTFSVSLPLTLAILDGMIVRSARQRMVIPLSAIVETQTIAAARVEMLGPNQSVVQLHDTFVPLMDLAESMGFTQGTVEARNNQEGALLFVQSEDQAPFALSVDAIEAQRQVVIKGLSESFGRVPCVSAATILGDGHVALIVDLSGLATTAGLPNLSQPIKNTNQESVLQ